MGELRGEGGVLDRVMMLYELLPAEIKDVSGKDFNLPDWLEKVNQAMEEKLVMAGIILLPNERRNLDVRLKKEFVKQTGGIQPGETTIEIL